MKGVLNDNFKSLFLEDEYFNSGDDIEILKVIESSDFRSNVGYVVFHPINFESITLDSIYVDITN